MQDPKLWSTKSTVISFVNFTVTLDLCHGSIMCKKAIFSSTFLQCGSDIILFYSVNLTTFEKGISQFINEWNSENTLCSYHTNTYYLIYMYKVPRSCWNSNNINKFDNVSEFFFSRTDSPYVFVNVHKNPSLFLVTIFSQMINNHVGLDCDEFTPQHV